MPCILVPPKGSGPGPAARVEFPAICQLLPRDVSLTTNPASDKRFLRYRSQSLRLLDNALGELRNGHWSRTEELVWGSLTLAVKGVALSRGDELEDDQAVREYARRLGQELRDRRIREAFNQLTGFSETVERVRDSRMRLDFLFIQLDDISAAIERLWELASGPQESLDPGGDPELAGS